MDNWTDDQLRAINESGKNIIVSAGAGSGKTAVLTERVITKLKNNIDINKLLVLTFTNAAANEMKERIRTAIIENKLDKQLDYLDSAYITTFDSFSNSIVRKYHYLLNIPSDIKVIDDTIIAIEIENIVDTIFENSYGNSKFDNFISSFCTKDDSNLRKFIIELNYKLDLKSDKKHYLDGYMDTYFSDKFIDSIIEEYTSKVMKLKNDLNELYLDLRSYLTEKQAESLYEYLNKALNATTYDEVIGAFSGSVILRNLPDEAKTTYEKLKKIKDKIIDMTEYNSLELKNNLLSTKDNVEVIVDIIKELDYKLEDYKLKNNSYTFTDIAKMAIKIVKENVDVKNELKDYFAEIMVDEYQDTSDLQEEFISLISNNNVYMVGDIKQSIYRFRNANPDIFRNKYNDYSNNNGGIKIDLLKNFRSRKEVLENINEIFDLVMDEKIGNAKYKESHRMVHGNDMYDNVYDENYNMDIMTYDIDEYKDYDKAEIEAFIIANDIKKKISSNYQIIDKKTKQLRNINYGDFSIIMDRGSTFDIVAKILEYNGIPSVVWQDEKLNLEDDIAVLKNIINLIIKIKEKDFKQEFRYYFTSVARSYLFNYDDKKILNIFVNNSFYDDLVYKKCADIATSLDGYTNNELLDRIINDFNIYEKTISKGDVEASVVRIDVFAKLFESLAGLGYTPYDLPMYFKNSSKLDIKYSLNTKVSNRVNILNIHKSKGLEYSICYFAGLSKEFNNQDVKSAYLYDSKYGIIIPSYQDGLVSTVLKDLYVSKFKEEDISEKIRLLYVALTRTKEKMILVMPKFSETTLDDDSRLNCKSLYDIINLTSNVINKYEVDADVSGITKKYNLSKSKMLPDIFIPDDTISLNEINIPNEEISSIHFSKENHVLYDMKDLEKMKYGTYMHYLFEVMDFKNPKTDNENVLSFIEKLDLNCEIYKEYEFLYIDDKEEKHGIIDLMLEYKDHIDIYDYKLKNTSDEAYLKQLAGYKKYIENKTKKQVNTYLYSILDKKIEKIKF